MAIDTISPDNSQEPEPDEGNAIDTDGFISRLMAGPNQMAIGNMEAYLDSIPTKPKARPEKRYGPKGYTEQEFSIILNNYFRQPTTYLKASISE